MVLTRKSCMSENFRASKRILRDIKHEQTLRPRVSNPDYREESPDEIAYLRNILKVDVKNKNSLSHKLRIRSDNAKKAYKEIRRYELRTTPNDGGHCDISHVGNVIVNSLLDSDHKSDNNMAKRAVLGSPIKDDRVSRSSSAMNNDGKTVYETEKKKTTVFGVNKCKTTFKRRLSGTFTKHSDMDNSQICYDNDRRYPIRLRRRPADVYMVNSTYSSGKKRNWHDSITSPNQSCFDTGRHRKLELYSKQSDTDDSDDLLNDEIRFENRKQRSIQRTRMELNPINMSSMEKTMGLFNDRNLARSSLADIEPMAIDKTITFDMIGGNKSCIQALKESVILPLVYPEVFEKLAISPPRGLLFYGSPGSGKTLMARALVNECSNSGNCKMAFFMRKGADCLSKWVGESERQLRLLFDQAYKMRPSIIFFDEIDGLAPVRSARQDQIHSSIVSTLLSLIDGLDDRGEIIVIGATNRLDSIDPALRRPGRFDREFLFTLPEENVRKDIMRIHTRNWQHPLEDTLVDDLASATKGFSGADLKGLVIETGLCALRRRYPQIYKSQKKLKLNINEINVKEEDFRSALKVVRPSNERSGFPVHRKIPQRIRSLIETQYSSLKDKVSQTFREQVFTKDCAGTPAASASFNIFNLRLLVTGYEVDSVLAGLFHDIHNVNIACIDSLYLGTNNGLSVEEKLSHLFHEVQKSQRSIIYIPHIDITLHGMSLAAQNMLLSMVNGAIPGAEINEKALLVLITLSNSGNKSWSDVEFDNCHSDGIWRQFGLTFHSSSIVLNQPTVEQRISYFSQLKDRIMEPVRVAHGVSDSASHKQEVLIEVEMQPKTLTKVELDKLEVEEDNVLRKFRIILRTILVNLAKERKFQIFHTPVDELEVPDYYNIVTNPMDLSTMRQKVDLYNYYTFEELKSDLHLISANALLYNPPTNAYLKDIRRHAYEFHDIADTVFEEHLNADFSKTVSDIHQSRMKRNYYEQKKQTLTKQPSEVLEFLTDLNGSKYEISNGPLLKSQVEMYHNFYSKSTRGKLVDVRSHSDSETVRRRSTLRESVRCKSMCDLVLKQHSPETVKKTFESFKSMGTRDKEACKGPVHVTGVDEGPTPECSSDNAGDPSSEAVLVDEVALERVVRHAALVSGNWSILQLEGLFSLLLEEIGKYRVLTDRSALPRELRAIVDRYVG